MKDSTIERPPNILYIHSHDTGRHVQPYGYWVRTPHLQMLAEQGVLFRKAFCASPTCSGSRASLLTGQYCHNNGMLGLAHRGWKLNDYGEHLIHPLREAGYRSILIGEQHISEDPGVIGYDEVVPVDSNHASQVAPAANAMLRETSEPFFMSVGFFETHREFELPASVRDSLYAQPAPNLPDLEATRDDMAAFKASARSLDEGIGSVLNELHRAGLEDNTLIVCTTDHGLAFPRQKATLYDRGTGVLTILRGPGGFTGGKVFDAMVSHLDIYPTLCEIAGVPTPDFAYGKSILPLIEGEVDRLHDEVFTEMTFHAAYEPQRAVRTERWKYIRRFHDYEHPVLANCDDSATKDLLVAAGWGDQIVAEERLHDLVLDPNENANLAYDESHADVRADLAARLEAWMEATDDPLLDGPVEPPAGALVNSPDQVSPAEPTIEGWSPTASGGVR
ncbi:MAG: sulfatase [Solirubrobacterales bacterium]